MGSIISGDRIPTHACNPGARAVNTRGGAGPGQCNGWTNQRAHKPIEGWMVHPLGNRFHGGGNE
jgi:hypothetical protein